MVRMGPANASVPTTPARWKAARVQRQPDYGRQQQEANKTCEQHNFKDKRIEEQLELRSVESF